MGESPSQLLATGVLMRRLYVALLQRPGAPLPKRRKTFRLPELRKHSVIAYDSFVNVCCIRVETSPDLIDA